MKLPKLSNIEFTCDCHDPRCGMVGFSKICDTLDIYFIPHTKDRADRGIVLDKKHVKKLLEFLTKHA